MKKKQLKIAIGILVLITLLVAFYFLALRSSSVSGTVNLNSALLDKFSFKQIGDAIEELRYT